MIGDALQVLAAGGSLSEHQSEAVFGSLLAGELDPAQVGAILAFLRARRPAPEELVGAVRAMRAQVTPVARPLGQDGEHVIDTCGTGGARKLFNISTAAALIIAGAAGPRRVRVAKHGNRSRTGRGSAEVLKALGVNVDASPRVQARCLDEAGVCFSFAINHHPGMRHAAGPRKALGFTTVFNLLGPLTNPAGATRQLIGVHDPAVAPLVADTLRRLGATRAMVVHGDGLDELTTTGPNLIAHVQGGSFRAEQFDPATLSLRRARVEDLEAHDLDAAVAAVGSVLSGQNSPRREIACLNAAAGLVVGGAASDMHEGFDLAEGSIDTGRARACLETLIACSNAPEA